MTSFTETKIDSGNLKYESYATSQTSSKIVTSPDQSMSGTAFLHEDQKYVIFSPASLRKSFGFVVKHIILFNFFILLDGIMVDLQMYIGVMFESVLVDIK